MGTSWRRGDQRWVAPWARSPSDSGVVDTRSRAYQGRSGFPQHGWGNPDRWPGNPVLPDTRPAPPGDLVPRAQRSMLRLIRPKRNRTSGLSVDRLPDRLLDRKGPRTGTDQPAAARRRLGTVTTPRWGLATPVRTRTVPRVMPTRLEVASIAGFPRPRAGTQEVT